MESMKRKQTMSILEKLRASGMPRAATNGEEELPPEDELSPAEEAALSPKEREKRRRKRAAEFYPVQPPTEVTGTN